MGGRTLFLVNALKLASQAKETFAKVWSEATLGEYTGSQKDMTQTVIFATVQSISKDLEKFSPTDFDYLIVDECHHAAANTYQKIFTYFHPKFILGLTATPERSDGEDMLELFQNVAHKMDLKTAVERGVLVPIRCIRVKTNIDLTDVRINGIKYNSQDLESKLFIPERNQLIVDTYLKYVNGKKTVIFCASVDHAAEIAKLLRDSGVKAEAVSGRDRVEVREKILKDYETGSTNVLCACDLLNEGWDSPHTTVLFMARPTMSKTIYLQQLGRGTRRCPGKEDLLVIDFVDNQGAHEIIGFKDLLHNAHRLFGFSEIKDNEDTFNNLTRLAQDAGVPIGTFWEQEGKDDVWLRNHIIEIKSPILIERNNASIYSDKKVKSQQILCIGCTEKKLKEILQK